MPNTARKIADDISLEELAQLQAPGWAAWARIFAAAIKADMEREQEGKREEGRVENHR